MDNLQEENEQLRKENEFLKKKLKVLQEQNLELIQGMENVKSDFEIGGMR